jgi:hypothetical protein
MNKIDNQNHLPNYVGHGSKVTKIENDTVQKQMSSEHYDKLALHNRSVITMKIVLQSVSSQFSSKFEKFNQGSSEKSNPSLNKLGRDPSIEGGSVEGLFDFDKVVQTVMDFVGGRILAAKAGGANDEELKEMFEQGRAGANLGIDQAIGDLKGLAMLNDDLSLGIEKSREGINNGIDDLYEQIFPSAQPDLSDIELESAMANNISLDTDLYTSNAKSSDLTITTTDGDIVSISFSELQEHASKERYQYSENGEGPSENYSIANSQYHEVNFSYSVDGDLDDDEKAAIEALIKDVNSLQKDFFSGNVDKAFEKALELGFDNKEISNFSMDLQHKQTSSVSQTYSEVAELDKNASSTSNKELRPLIDFLGHFKQLQESAEQLLSKNDDTFGQLLNAVFKAEFGDNELAKEKFDKVIEIAKPDKSGLVSNM